MCRDEDVLVHHVRLFCRLPKALAQSLDGPVLLGNEVECPLLRVARRAEEPGIAVVGSICRRLHAIEDCVVVVGLAGVPLEGKSVVAVLALPATPVPQVGDFRLCDGLSHGSTVPTAPIRPLAGAAKVDVQWQKAHVVVPRHPFSVVAEPAQVCVRVELALGVFGLLA